MTKLIKLQGTNGKGHTTIVDDDTFDRLGDLRWSLSTKGYAYRVSSERKNIYLHREVMDLDLRKSPPGMQVDHINMDKLDNRRANLRLATPSQNRYNSNVARGSSSFAGVSWSKGKGMWAAYIDAEGVRYRLGYFKKEEHAALAYNLAAVEKHGEFARLNNLDGLIPEGFVLPARSVRKKTSRYPGVSWNPRALKWCARITINGKTYHLGYFDSEEDAALAYEKAPAVLGLGE